MKRLTTDNPKDNIENSLNLFYAKDGWTWIRGGGPAPDYADMSLCDFVRMLVKANIPDAELPEDDDALSELMYEWLMDEPDSAEGIISLLYAAGWAFAELRHRLAAYEDTGLEPEQINHCKLALMGKSVAEITEFEGVPIERLKQLAEADKAGRLVVLPCKVGDVLYDRSGKKAEVEEICIGRQDVAALVCFECDYNCDLCAFNSWYTEHSGENSCNGEYGQAAISLTEIGKTVFLTREEAERMLEGGADHA